MKSKKLFLACLAALCAMSIFAGCGDDAKESSLEPETSSSQSEDSSSETEDSSSETEDSSSETEDSSSETEDSSIESDDSSVEPDDSSSSEEVPVTYTVKFVNDDGSEISVETYNLGDEVSVPADPVKDATEYFSYAFAGWDQEVTTVAGDVTYTATYTATIKEGYAANNVTENAGVIVLEAGSIGNGANYSQGQNNDDGDEKPSFVHQSYFAINGNYALNDYVAFDFTGKNMPEIAFFANNYNDSMYAEGTSKQGIVVVTGITTWEGKLESGVNGNGTQINYGFPYMMQDASNGAFTQGAFAESKLGRANLVDGTHYRVIMGFSGSGSAITLHWYLYDIDTETVVEQSSMATWNFFTGSDSKVGNMTINDLSGSIVLYGKFGTTCTIDKIHGVYEDTTLEEIIDGPSDPEDSSQPEDTSSEVEDSSSEVEDSSSEVVDSSIESDDSSIESDDSSVESDDSSIESDDSSIESGDSSSSEEAPATYTVKFVDENGEEISSKIYEEGATVEEPEAPIKAADNTYTYQFAGWDKEVTAVAGDVTYTATYTATYIEYTVKFVNDDDSEISTATYHYGDTVAAPEAPTKESTEYFNYTFAGWDQEVTAVAGDATYKATYTATIKEGYAANNVTTNEGAIVLGAGSIGGGANYTLGQNNDDGDETPSFVHQSYFAIDGKYALNDYIVFDFTGKNMPEIAFFANNYNDSMYAEGTNKQGIVVVTGITTWDGQLGSGVNSDGTQINYGFPYMIQDAAGGNFVSGAFANSALGRANLVDDTKYRVVMGFSGSGNAITLNWYLYNFDTNEVVEQSSMTTWNFFTGSNEQVGNMTINDLSGSIVLYGKFGTTCTIDKIHGVYEDTTIEGAISIMNGETFTVTFQDENGNELQKVEGVKYGETVTYGNDLPTLDKAEDEYFTYAYAWDKEFGAIKGDTVYTLKLVATIKEGYAANNVTTNEGAIVLGASSIGGGANYTFGQNNDDGDETPSFVRQSYFAIDGKYALNDYIVFDFTGKNMPEIAFFANNYNDSMYAEGTSKQGIVVVTGITTWDGQLGSGVNSNGTQINYGFPYMIQDAANGGFCDGAFANSALGRANLVDGTHYRVIMGFTEHAESAKITLNWCLYNLDTNEVVEQSSMSSWGFFTGSDPKVGKMTRDQLSGSIVLYGKFGTTCTVSSINIERGGFADVVAKHTTQA